MRRDLLIGASILLALAITPASGAELLPRTGHWIEVNKVNLRYELSGAGSDVVVLIHDMGMNLEAWDEIVPGIQQGRQVLRYDLRGFGLSEKFRTQVSMDDHLEDLRALLDALKLTRPVTVVGGSIGGAIALKFAMRYPDRVKAVVGLNAVTRINRDPKEPPPNPALVGRNTPGLFETEGVRAYLKSDLDWLYPPQLRTPARMARFMGIETAQDPQVRAIMMRMKSPAVDSQTELPKVRAPVLLIAGMINSTYTADQWRAIAAAIPNARLEMIQTAHHAAFESPELVLPVLRPFLDAHR